MIRWCWVTAVRNPLPISRLGSSTCKTQPASAAVVDGELQRPRKRFLPPALNNSHLFPPQPRSTATPIPQNCLFIPDSEYKQPTASINQNPPSPSLVFTPRMPIATPKKKKKNGGFSIWRGEMQRAANCMQIPRAHEGWVLALAASGV